MAESGYEERTELATPRRREEARKEGQVARSADLGTALSVVGALVILAQLGPNLVTAIEEMISCATGNCGDVVLDAHTLQNLITAWLLPVGIAFLFIAFGFAALGIFSAVLQGGFLFIPQNLVPKWNRVDPVQGFSRLFSIGSVGGFVAGVLKLAAVAGIAYFFLIAQYPDFGAYPRLHERELLPHAASLISALGWRIAAAMIAIGVVDFLFQRWRYERDLRMTRQQVKDEHKQEEGDPQIKQRVRQIQRQRAMRRMMEEVPKATVVITNPTHFAVALRYESTMRAPAVVAKGQNLLALRIRGIAAEHGVPVEENPPLARGLYKAAQIGQEIPPEFFKAIAQVLAMLMRKRAEKARLLKGILR